MSAKNYVYMYAGCLYGIRVSTCGRLNGIHLSAKNKYARINKYINVEAYVCLYLFMMSIRMVIWKLTLTFV